MCYLYSVQKLDIGFNQSTIMFGFKLLAIICLFVIFCKIVQYFITGSKLSFLDSIYNFFGNILSYLENLFNCKISWNKIILFGVCLIICYFIGFKKIFNFIKNNILSIFLLIFLYYIVYYTYILLFYSYLLFLPRGKILVTKPVYINKEKHVGKVDYCKNKFNYSFSCWIYINPHPPSTGVAYTKFTNILNFRNNPVISYNNMEETLKITLKNNNKFKEIKISKNNFKLQKWTNIIFNYIDGTVDIFVNGKIIYTDNFVISNLDNTDVFIGENNGIDGGICNVQYYNHPLIKNKIDDIYNYFKNKTPPI